MLIKIPKSCDVNESEVTEESLFYQRRQFIEKGAKVLAGVGLLSSGLSKGVNNASAAILKPELEFPRNSTYKVNDSLNTYEQTTAHQLYLAGSVF